MECEKVNSNLQNRKHLAWHETLELHELVAFQSTQLVGCKKKLPSIQDPALRSLYTETIKCLEQNLRDLLPYYHSVPTMQRNINPSELTVFDAGSLLGLCTDFRKNLCCSYYGNGYSPAEGNISETPAGRNRPSQQGIQIHV